MTDHAQLVIVRNPFDRRIRDERSLPLDASSVAEILAANLPLCGEVSVAIDGELITREEWDVRTLKPGEQLVVMPTVHGGDNTLGMVLMVAVAVMAPYAAAAINTSMGLGLAAGSLGMGLLTAGVGLLGSMVVGGLMAPQKPNLPSRSLQSYDNSPAYSWSPATTQQPGGVINRAYGLHKLYGNIIAGYIENRGNTGQEQIAHLLVDLGMGPYQRLYDFKLNDQPVGYYSGVTITERLGHINQSIISGFNDTRLTRPVSAKVVKDSPVVRDTVGRDYDALEIVLLCPNGLWYSNDVGGLDTVTVNLTVEISADSGATWVPVGGTTTLSGATQQQVRRVIRADSLVRGTQYKVRVSNLSVDQTSSRYGDDLYLAEINEVMYDDFQYPRTVLVGVDALATNQISGSIKFSCMAEAAIVRVFDGATWSVQWTRNPAWIIWDILTQPVLDNNLNVVRYEGMQPARLLPRLSSFKAFADFCDTLVPDGKGGMEKRCYWDGVFDTPTSAWEAALEVAATARAQLVPIGTSIMVVFDDVRTTPTQLFTVGNTAVNSFHETFLPMQDRAASIEINYTNAEQDYARDTITVVNPAITDSAAQRSSAGLRGITRASQAWREAMWRLKRNELLKRSSGLGVDIDALACTVGDMIWVQNDVTRWGVGGRAVSGSTSTKLQLDQSVTLDPGKTYELKLRLADDTLVSRTITTAAGTVTAVDVAVAFPSVPDLYDVWAIGETGKAVKEFLVLDVQRDGNQRVKLGLIEYNASLYGLDSGIPALPTPDVSASGLPVVSNIRIEELMERSSGGVVDVHLMLHFDTAETQRVEVYEGGRPVGNSLTGTFRRNNVTSGQAYQFELRPFSPLGVSPAATWRSISHSVIGKITPPLDVTGFIATRNGNDIYFNWNLNSEIDLAGWEVRLGTSWDTAVVVGTAARNTRELKVTSPQGGTFLIKAFDTSAPVPNYSVNAAQCILASNDNINVVLTDDDSTYGWPGTLTNMVKAGAVLNFAYAKTWADLTQPWTSYTRSWMAESDPLTAGSYVTDTHDIGAVMSCCLHVSPSLSIIAMGQTWSSWALPWSHYGNNFTWEGPLGAVTAIYEIETSLDGVAWTGWQPFTPGLRTLRYYRLRASFAAQPGYQIQFNGFPITVDVPDRVVRFVNQAVPSGGLSLVFNPPFIAVKNIKMNLLNGAAGDRYTVSNKTVNGADINVYDNALAAKAGTVDVEVYGYGFN